ncbi:MAG: aminotransferase class V-fold PLP-dependent enzyme [Pseudomonadota bacterium]
MPADGDELLDVRRLRRDTPACEGILHFDSAGASLMPDPVYERVVEHLELERRVGGYEAARLAAEDLEAFYDEVAALLGADRDEIAFVENATRAWDMAFYGLPLGAGDRVITHASEYASNYLALLQQAGRVGLEIDLAPSDDTGQIDVAALESLIRPTTRAIAITHVPSQGGLVNPARAVGGVARRHDLFYLLDACQSAGQVELDVRRIGCHVLSGTGRKFLRGPRGTGFLYVARDCHERIQPPFVDLRAATWSAPDRYELAPGARRYETFESNVAGRLGLARAVRYARERGIAAIEARVGRLAELLRSRLQEVPGVVVRDRGARRSGIVSFTRDGESAAELKTRLREHGAYVSVSDASVAQLDLGARELPAVVRASVHYFNTEDEIDKLARLIAAAE